MINVFGGSPKKFTYLDSEAKRKNFDSPHHLNSLASEQGIASEDITFRLNSSRFNQLTDHQMRPHFKHLFEGRVSKSIGDVFFTEQNYQDQLRQKEIQGRVER
jgi:hypothetical protein